MEAGVVERKQKGGVWEVTCTHVMSTGHWPVTIPPSSPWRLLGYPFVYKGHLYVRVGIFPKVYHSFARFRNVL